MKQILSLYTALLFILCVSQGVQADEVEKLGMHVLRPEEFVVAKQVLKSDDTAALQTALQCPITFEGVLLLIRICKHSSLVGIF